MPALFEVTDRNTFLLFFSSFQVCSLTYAQMTVCPKMCIGAAYRTASVAYFAISTNSINLYCKKTSVKNENCTFSEDVVLTIILTLLTVSFILNSMFATFRHLHEITSTSPPHENYGNCTVNPLIHFL